MVESHVGPRAADAVAAACPAWRNHLSRHWTGREPSAWDVPCHVVIHASQTSYLRAVGGLGVPTNGSSFTRVKEGRVTERRIDLNGGRLTQALAALPHELAHVVLMEEFLDSTLPRWVDEGMALAADTAEKRARHRRDLEQAIAGGYWLPLQELVTLEAYPRREQIAAFYAQSASLVEYLSHSKGPSHFVRFVRAAQEHGFERSLREHYEIDSIAELERRWLRHAIAAPPRDSTRSTDVADLRASDLRD